MVVIFDAIVDATDATEVTDVAIVVVILSKPDLSMSAEDSTHVSGMFQSLLHVVQGRVEENE